MTAKKSALAKASKKAPAPVASDLEAELGGGVTTSPEQIAAVDKLIGQGVTLTTRIENGEALLKELKGDLNTLLSDTLPKALASANTSLHKVATGPNKAWKVEIKPFIGGSIAKPDPIKDEPEAVEEKTKKRAAAFQFIRDQEAEAIIKNVLSVEFDKGEDNLAGEVKAKLEELGIEYDLTEGVHHQTFIAFVKEAMKNGVNVPLDEMGLYAGQAAKLTAPKKKDLET